MDTFKQKQTNINEIKVLMTQKAAPISVPTNNNNSEAAMQKLVKIMQGGNLKKDSFTAGVMISTRNQNTRVVPVPNMTKGISKRPQQMTAEEAASNMQRDYMWNYAILGRLDI